MVLVIYTHFQVLEVQVDQEALVVVPEDIILVQAQLQFVAAHKEIMVVDQAVVTLPLEQVVAVELMQLDQQVQVLEGMVELEKHPLLQDPQ